MASGSVPAAADREVRILITNGLYQERCVSLSRNDRRPAVPAGLPARPCIQQEPAFRVHVRVTLVTMLDQNRPDAFLEEGLTIFGSRSDPDQSTTNCQGE
jgi:hypothetical protein